MVILIVGVIMVLIVTQIVTDEIVEMTTSTDITLYPTSLQHDIHLGLQNQRLQSLE